MKILITGGTGLIGQAFVRQFNENHYTVLSRSVYLVQQKLPKQVEVLSSLSSLQNLDDYDAVINLAGEPIIDKRWTEKQKNIICESRWHITQQLVDLFKKSEAPPEVFLSGSAIGVYGNRGDSLITEECPLSGNDFPIRICRQWEKIAKQAEPYTRVIYLRTGIVLDPRGGALAKMLLPFKLCLGGTIGDGRQYMSWIHYLDHIRAMDYLLKNRNISGAVNLVAPEPERNYVFARALAGALNRIAVLPAPKIVLRNLLGESSCLLLDSQKVIPQKLIDNKFEFSFPDLKMALANLLEKNK